MFGKKAAANDFQWYYEQLVFFVCENLTILTLIEWPKICLSVGFSIPLSMFHSNIKYFQPFLVAKVA